MHTLSYSLLSFIYFFIVLFSMHHHNLLDLAPIKLLQINKLLVFEELSVIKNHKQHFSLIL